MYEKLFQFFLFFVIIKHRIQKFYQKGMFMWLSESDFQKKLEKLDIVLSKRTLQFYRERRLLNVRRNPLNKRLIQYHDSEIKKVQTIRKLLEQGYTLESIKEHFHANSHHLYSGRKDIITALGLHFKGQNYSVWYAEGEDSVIITVYEQYAVICFRTEQFDISDPPEKIDIINTAEIDWYKFHLQINENGVLDANGIF